MKLLVLLLIILQVFAKTSQHPFSQPLLQDVLLFFQQQLLSSAPLNLLNISLPTNPLNLTSPPCIACHSFFSSLNLIPSKSIINFLQRIATQYCTRTKMQVRQVCKGAVGVMTGYLLRALWGKYADPHSICHKLRLCPKEYNILNADDYAKQLLKDKPSKKQEEPTKKKILNVLHVSDIHIDFFYVEGAPTKCDQPVCCRNGVNKINGSIPAGYWGTSKGDCDIPYHLFNLFLQTIKKQKIDMIIWTGDNTAHDIWKQSEDYNLNFTTIISNRFKDVFPGVPIYSTIGNHESFPVNVYDFGNQKAFNRHLASAWADFIDENGIKELKQNAYYHTKHPQYNFVVVSLNTQAWNNQNWILLKDPTDPGGMLKWLEKVLRQAEKDNNLVYIIGHVSPNSAIIQYSKRYYAIIDRFNYIIRGQFFGHNHRQHIAFFSAINDTSEKIIGNYLIPSSLTTSSDKNSNYRIMQVDADTMRVLDYSQYTLKLQDNNSRQVKPKYQLTYSFLSQYNLTSMNFEGLELFRERLRHDKDTQVKYSYHIGAEMSTGKASATLHCETYPTAELESKCANGKFVESMFEKVSGKWRERK